jgi:hypothetical protein
VSRPTGLRRSIVQGKLVARRGRKARDLLVTKTARLPRKRRIDRLKRSHEVKSILARFTAALALLASVALTVGAGQRWH